MTKKHKKIIAAVIVIILAFLALMYCKIIPSIMVSKAISAIDRDDVSTFEKYYEMPDYSPFRFAKRDVDSYINEQESKVADEINEKFQNFETKSEIEKYVKKKYPVLYRYCLRSNSRYTSYILTAQIDSKQKCIESKSNVEELSQRIENLKAQITPSVGDSINATLDVGLEIDRCKANVESIGAQLNPDDLTYINKIEPILDDLGSELEEMEQEVNEW